MLCPAYVGGIETAVEHTGAVDLEQFISDRRGNDSEFDSNHLISASFMQQGN